MSLHDDLLAQARRLASAEPRRPRQASLRRAVSASYYALYHLLVSEATGRMFAGARLAALRGDVARAFAHRTMKDVARQFSSRNVSPRLRAGLNGQPLQAELVRVADSFVRLQDARSDADYDTARTFRRGEALVSVQISERAFADWRRVRKSVQADTFLAGLLVFGNLRGRSGPALPR